jgi:uncharacterized damage-inducible protein DinB
MKEEPMSTNREFFAKTWASEQPKFVKVLQALRDEKLDYKPHERSMSAHLLASQLVQEVRALASIAQYDEAPWTNPNTDSDAGAMAAEFDRYGTALANAVGALDDAAWDGPAKMLMEGGAAWESTKKEMFWGFLFDMIHHRGQLTTYIRPMGGKVPSIYGPSGDEK